jgi:hypothetical protein
MNAKLTTFSAAAVVALGAIAAVSGFAPVAAQRWTCTFRPLDSPGTPSTTEPFTDTGGHDLVGGIDEYTNQPEHYEVVVDTDHALIAMQRFIGLSGPDLPHETGVNILLLNKKTLAFRIVGLSVDAEGEEIESGHCKRL